MRQIVRSRVARTAAPGTQTDSSLQKDNRIQIIADDFPRTLSRLKRTTTFAIDNTCGGWGGLYAEDECPWILCRLVEVYEPALSEDSASFTHRTARPQPGGFSI